ncbi:helix-turn-helix domain-containing protein [Pantoea vagans]|uniref:helix-turn-helix domain-containing protein n=1 Tax=Pantoea vagans TaxID=470934 RepID=UPI00068174EF|nr:helix-turn-helix domain-containing protein [Pantoea vagans]KNH33893.1 transcriptional regulator [Pantoea vagans]
MAKVSISEAARLTGKSRTTLHRLIKTGDLSTCAGVRNAKMVDISELIRVFGDISKPVQEQPFEQVPEQRVTVTAALSEQMVSSLKQEVEHLRTLVSAQESHIDSLKQSLQLLEHKKDVQQPLPPPVKWWQFWK